MAQVRLFDVVDVDAVVADFAVGNIIEAVDQIRNCRLAGACCADEGELLTGLCIKRDIVKHCLIRHIAEIHVKEPHVALQQPVFHRAVVLLVLPRPLARALSAGDDCAVFLAAARERDGSFVAFRLLVQQIKDSASARNRHRNSVHLLRDLRNVCGKLLAHAEIRCNRRDGQGSGDGSERDEVLNRKVRNQTVRGDQQTTCKYSKDVKQISNIAHDRHEDVCKAVCLARVAEELIVELVKILLCRFLMAEDLDDLLTVHHFLDEAFCFAEGVLLADKVFCGLAADIFGGKRHADDAENDDEHQRQAVIDHHAQHAEHRQTAGQKVRQALGDNLTQRVCIVRETRHDIAARRLIKIGDRQALHGREHAHARLVQKALRDMRHELGIDRRENQADKIERCHRKERLCQLRQNRCPAGGQALFNIAGDRFNIRCRRNTNERGQDNAD